MQQLTDFLGFIENDIIWTVYFLIPLLLLTGLYLTIRMRFIQFHKLFYALWLALIKRKEDQAEGDISHYQALSTALAATVGVGNIAGVGTAIAIGGPGALFWMWVTGLVGIATKYCEAFLGVRFRGKDSKGEQSGGPMFYLSRGIPGGFGAFLGVSFAVLGVLASFGIGNMTQANSVASAANENWGVAPWITGAIITILAFAVIIGGIKSIGRVTAAFVPLMIVFYIGAALWVILANVGNLGSALATIFTDAFAGTEQVAGGFAGAAIIAAISAGVGRGLFSNESGLGTGGIAAAAAKTTHPVRQAMVSMTQTFIDTLVVVSFTGLALVTTGVWTKANPDDDAFTGAALTIKAFDAGLPGNSGGTIVALGLVFFAFSTILGWGYYGERMMDRLVGRVGVMPYRVVFCLVVFVGATAELNAVWSFSGIMNGLMAVPNLIGLVILSGLIARETREFFAQPDWKEFKPVQVD